MQAPDMHAHAANCMRTFAAPGIILFLTQSCGFSMPHGLDAAELGKVSANDAKHSLFDPNLNKCWMR
ncbi:unnamed protein product, partial [Ectocarpus sp. 12 AP-2014]